MKSLTSGWNSTLLPSPTPISFNEDADLDDEVMMRCHVVAELYRTRFSRGHMGVAQIVTESHGVVTRTSLTCLNGKRIINLKQDKNAITYSY